MSNRCNPIEHNYITVCFIDNEGHHKIMCSKCGKVTFGEV